MTNRSTHRRFVSLPRGIGVITAACMLWPACASPHPEVPPDPDVFDSQVNRIAGTVDFDRVAVMLQPVDRTTQQIPSSEWTRIERAPSGRFLHTLLGQPVSCTAEAIARSCDFNPDDRALTTQQLESLRELIGCFLPALKEAEHLQKQVESAEIEAAFQGRRGRSFGEFPPCSEQERRRADQIAEAAFARTARRLQQSGTSYDESSVRRSAREAVARRMDPDRGKRMSWVRSNGPDGLTISIDDLPQTSRAYELILVHSHAMARSIATWFQNHRIVDGTRGPQLEAKIEKVCNELRAQIGAR